MSKPVSPTDLDAIYQAFIDAQALVFVAYRVIEVGDPSDLGMVSIALRQGVNALGRIAEQLDLATIRHAACLRNGTPSELPNEC
jgi:hypothetical protein